MANEKDIKNKVEELDDEALEGVSGGFGSQSETKTLGDVLTSTGSSKSSKPSMGGPITIPVQPKNPGSRR